MRKEILRKIFHIVSILLLIIPVEISGKYSITVLMFVMLFVFFPISYFKIKNPITNLYWKILEFVERDYNWKTLPGRQAFSLAVGFILVSLLFDKKTLEIAIITTAVYDGFATIFGKLFGKHKILNLNKSYEGTAVGIIANTIFLTLTLPLWEAFFISVVASFVELLSDSKKWYLDDNITVPLTVSCVYTLLNYLFI